MSAPQAAKSSIDWISMGIIGVVVVVSLWAIGLGLWKQMELKTVDRHWYEDRSGFEKAMAEHEKTGKPLFLYFYAPWCQYCKAFNESIMNTDKMVLFLGKNFIKVKVYPEKDPERLLMHQFATTGFPTVWVKYKDSEKFYKIERHENRTELTVTQYIERLQNPQKNGAESLVPKLDALPAPDQSGPPELPN